MESRIIGTDARSAFVRHPVPSTAVQRSPSRGDRECCFTAATRGLPAKAPATGSENFRSSVLDHTPPFLVWLAWSVGLCTARHDCPVATRAVSEILGPAVEAAAPPAGSPDHSHRNSPLNRANGGRQSIVACAADSRRTEDARDPDLRAHRLPDSSKASPATQSDLEDFPAQSPWSDGLHRFFHGADHQHEGAIRILRAGTSTARGVALWW